jgi:hypothetical protein
MEYFTQNDILDCVCFKQRNTIIQNKSVLNPYSERPNKMQQCIKVLLFLILNEAQHVSGDTSPIIRSLDPHKHPQVLHKWKVVGRAVVRSCQVAYAT